jgi:hypothetical protein
MNEVKTFTGAQERVGIKFAVVIADSLGKPFEEIKAALHPSVWNKLELLGADIFYVKGLAPTSFQKRINNFSETLRYSKFWRMQNIIDRVLLSKFNSKIPSYNIRQHRIEVEICEGLRTLGVKMLGAYKYMHQENYDFVFKTTLSSLVNEDALIQFIRGLPRDCVIYGGTYVSFGQHPFASGSNTLLSKKALEHLFENLSDWNHGFLDDVAMGRIFEGVVEITPIPSLHLESLDEIDALPDEKLKQTIHFRCKSRSMPRNDVEIIQQLRYRLNLLDDEIN